MKKPRRITRSAIAQLNWYFKRGKEYYSHVQVVTGILTLIGVYRSDILYAGIPFAYLFLGAFIGGPVTLVVIGYLDVRKGVVKEEMKFTSLNVNPVARQSYDWHEENNAVLKTIVKDIAHIKERLTDGDQPADRPIPQD